MLSLKDEAEIYRIGLVTGLFTKNDVISWADKIIEIQESIEYEIIEISLLERSNKADIALKLSEFKGVTDKHKIINTFLGLCSYFYNNKEFTADDMCTILYRLVSTKVDISICSDIEQKIHYLSDGYYLASEGIYGDLESICTDLNGFLEQYLIYAKEFSF
jgi:hypothetical protein